MTYIDIVLDIETVGIPPTDEEVQKYKSTLSPPSNYKSEDAIDNWWATKGRAKIAEFKNKRALQLGGAKICSAALCHVSKQEPQISNHEAKASEDEGEVLTWLAQELNDFACAIRLVTFNGDDFDIPMLALGFSKHNLALDFPLGRYESLDLFRRPFNRKHGLKTLCSIFGVGQSFEVLGLDGSSVEELYLKKDFETIEKYNLDDVRMTAELYLALSRTYKL